MNVKEIVTKHLKDIGADGLVSDGCWCGCSVDQLAPCDGNFLSCMPAKKVKATQPGDCHGYKYLVADVEEVE